MWIRWSFLTLELALIAGCVSQPLEPQEKPEASPEDLTPHSVPVNARVAEVWKQKAQKARQSGDLPGAIDCWHVVSLLSPDDEQAKRVLDALRQDAIEKAKESFAIAAAAHQKGDVEGATRSLTRVVALDPEHNEAVRMLREIERNRIEAIQADRAAQARSEASAGEARKARVGTRPGEPNGYGELDQRLGLFEAGDIATGLAEFQRYIETRPKDKEGRQRIVAAISAKARKLETEADDEQALLLYERLAAMGGSGAADAAARIQALRRQLSKKYLLEGQKIYRTDLDLAIRNWEVSVKFDPANELARSRLNDGLKMQETLRQIDRAKKSP